MANVLSQLFADIATEIKAKKGDPDTVTYKPSEFPEKIKSIDSSVDTYNLGLAEMLMLREPQWFGYDNSNDNKLSLRGFKLSDGNTLGNLPPYSFAGFSNVKGMRFSDVIFVYENVFLEDKALKIIDITVPDVIGTCGFFPNSLNGCTSLESIIVRGGGKGLERVNFNGTTGAGTNFYVYVPSAYYDTVISNIASDSPVGESRYRKLEDYPEIDNWYDTY